MKKRPLLTIAIPTYNGAKTIENLLNLLLPQCTPEIEILISNNCSTDNTNEIIECYRDKYPFIKNHLNEKNIGPDANFLQCMKMATGKFTWLVSDDDVVIDGSVCKILDFLTKYDEVGLVYLTTVDFRGKFETVDKCTVHTPILSNDICTTNKEEFMKYARQYWGFMSSFICNTDKFGRIANPEQYYGTYWLQSYIHALCAKGDSCQLGLVKGPCVGAGIYINTANFDSALINGLYYRKMLDFMVSEVGFSEKQLDALYVWRICLLGRHDILKEKASGIHKLNIKVLFGCTKHYWQAWITLYPIFLVPSFICKPAFSFYRKRKGIRDAIRVNRPE